MALWRSYEFGVAAAGAGEPAPSRPFASSLRPTPRISPNWRSVDVDPDSADRRGWPDLFTTGAPIRQKRRRLDK